MCFLLHLLALVAEVRSSVASAATTDAASAGGHGASHSDHHHSEHPQGDAFAQVGVEGARSKSNASAAASIVSSSESGDFGGWLKSWFSLRAWGRWFRNFFTYEEEVEGDDDEEEDSKEGSKEGEGEEGEASASSGWDDLPELEAFCGISTWRSESLAVDCGCCYDQYTGKPLELSERIYPSHLVEARATDVVKDEVVGTVPVFSVGGHKPDVRCDRERLFCKCEDSLGWAVTEAACVPGARCGRDLLGFALEGQETLRDCERPSEEGFEACANHGRASIGSSRCQDITLEHCGNVFARTRPGEWRMCKVAVDAPKTCGARVDNQTIVEGRIHDARIWALKNGYNPEFQWKIVQNENKLGWLQPSAEENDAPQVEEVRRGLRMAISPTGLIDE